ncbi:unnamed protein product [Sphagnum balticum]
MHSPVEQQEPMLRVASDDAGRLRTLLAPILIHLKRHALLILTFLGVLFGIVLGFSLRSSKLSQETIMLISFPGDLLMRMLKMLILPLIVSSLITGIILVISIGPGRNSDKQDIGHGTTQSPTTTQDAIMDLIRNIFPENLVQATIQQGSTAYVEEPVKLIPANASDTFRNGSNVTMKRTWTFKYTNNTNILGIITFCVILV